MTIRIRCRQQGPLIVDGDLGELELHDTDGTPIDLGGRERIMLCRCGASRSRPFCDGSHNRTDFEAE